MPHSRPMNFANCIIKVTGWRQAMRYFPPMYILWNDNTDYTYNVIASTNINYSIRYRQLNKYGIGIDVDDSKCFASINFSVVNKCFDIYKSIYCKSSAAAPLLILLYYFLIVVMHLTLIHKTKVWSLLLHLCSMIKLLFVKRMTERLMLLVIMIRV